MNDLASNWVEEDSRILDVLGRGSVLAGKAALHLKYINDKTVPVDGEA